MLCLSARLEETPNHMSSGKRTACPLPLDTGRVSYSGFNREGYLQEIICQIKCPNKFRVGGQSPGEPYRLLSKEFGGKQILGQFNQHDEATKMKLHSLYTVK